jgi:hypothetical protein
VFVGDNVIFETVSFDQLVWALLRWLVAHVLSGRDPRLRLLAGLVLDRSGDQVHRRRAGSGGTCHGPTAHARPLRATG